MCSNSDKGSVSSKIGVQFILQGNEGLISPFVEFDSSKNRSCSVRSNFCSLRVNNVYQDNTSGLIVRVSNFAGCDNLYGGILDFPWKMASAWAIPSKQSISYLTSQPEILRGIPVGGNFDL